jgi:MoxR-like ATPase
MPKNTKTQPQPSGFEFDDSDAELNDFIRSDFVFEAHARARLGKPRFVALKDWDGAFVRIVPPIDYLEHASRRGARDRRDRDTVDRLIAGLTVPKSLNGPATLHQVDELAAALFEEAPNFGPAIQAIRASAQTLIRDGARWLQFRPTVIQSDPGAGKTRLASRLAELSGLPLIYLDCAMMGNLTPIIGQDSSWSNSRASEIVEGIARLNVANPIVVLDELDKVRDYGRNSSPQPSEALVGLLEKRSAAAHLDHFSQLPIDLSFINWVILTNDLERLSRPLLDRCQVIRLAPPSRGEIALIAAREIARRGLEPELVTAITQAVVRGRIKSLRTLHKLLDAAAAASARPLLN